MRFRNPSPVPLIVAATLAYALALGVGFGGAPDWSALVAALFCVGAVLLGRLRSAALCVVFGAGLIIAQLDGRDVAACNRVLPALPGWRVLFEEDVRPGSRARGILLSGDCRLPVFVAVRSGWARGGDAGLVTGSLVISGRRAMLDDARISRPEPESRLVSVRAAAGTRIDRLFRTDSAVARALLIADTRGLSPAVRERYADAGLVHMLSISGLHVAIIAAALEVVFQLLRRAPRTARIGTLVMTAFYIAVIGAPAPAVRSGVMLAATMISRVLQRPTSPWAGIALGAAIPLLLDARTILDLGYQLSVAGIVALSASASLARRLNIGKHRYGVVGKGLLASTVATLVTAPLIAWHFGRISVIAPLTNLIAGPVVGVAQPMLFLALLLSPLDTVALFVADAAHPLLRAFDVIASAGATIPHAAIGVAPSLLTAACAGIAATAFVVAASSRFPARASLVGVSALTVMVWSPDTITSRGIVELHMIDVGQGDALALRSAKGRWLVVDAGRQWKGGDAGRSTVIPYLRRRGGEVVGFVLTHPHADHAGGGASLVSALRPSHFWDPAFIEGSAVYSELLRTVVEAGVRWQRVRPGERFDFDGALVEFLGPDSAWTAALDDPNEASTIMRVRIGTVRFLLVGDAEQAEEAWLLEHAGGSLRADILKVGHHGSSTSSTPRFLDAVAPRAALISVGAGNTYGHPSVEVLQSLHDRRARILRTDQLGSVIIRTDGSRIWIVTEGGTWELPPSSAEQ